MNQILNNPGENKKRTEIPKHTMVQPNMGSLVARMKVSSFFLFQNDPQLSHYLKIITSDYVTLLLYFVNVSNPIVLILARFPPVMPCLPFLGLRRHLRLIWSLLMLPSSKADRLRHIELQRLDRKNLTHSPLYGLPHELTLNIVNYLSTVEILTLRATTKKFHQLLRNPENIDETEKRRFLNLFSKSLFDRDCRLERAGELQSGTAVCGRCIETHSSSYFTAEQLSLNPEIRACIGWTRVFRICPHRAFPLAELQRKQATGKLWLWKCRNRDCPAMIFPDLSPRSQPYRPRLFRNLSTSAAVTLITFTPQDLPDSGKLLDRMRSSMSRIAMCPHSSSDPKTVRRLCSQIVSDFQWHDASSRYSKSWICHNEHCRSHVSLYRAHSLETGLLSVELSCHRNITAPISLSFLKPTSKEWLCQTSLEIY